VKEISTPQEEVTEDYNLLKSVPAQLSKLEKTTSQLKHNDRIQDINIQSLAARIEKLEMAGFNAHVRGNK
jgi:hypothetical protein